MIDDGGDADALAAGVVKIESFLAVGAGAAEVASGRVVAATSSLPGAGRVSSTIGRGSLAEEVAKEGSEGSDGCGGDTETGLDG